MKTHVKKQANLKEHEFVFEYNPFTDENETPELKSAVVKVNEPTWDQVAEAYKYISSEGKVDLITPGKMILDLCATEIDDEIMKNNRAMLSVCSHLAIKFVFPITTDIKKN